MTASSSLWDHFAALPDPRSPLGRRHPLPAVLGLVTVAVLCGARSLEAIAQFARDRGRAFAAALGFTRPDTPCKATLSNLLRRLDVAAFEAALGRWVQSRCPQLGESLALDGKTRRGSGGYQVPGVHLLSAYAPHVAAVVGQIRVDSKTNEYQAALELLGVLPLQGKGVTGDALFCHRDFCQAVLNGGGDYLLTVKDNQPQLHFAIASMFAESVAFSPLPAAALATGTG